MRSVLSRFVYFDVFLLQAGRKKKQGAGICDYDEVQKSQKLKPSAVLQSLTKKQKTVISCHIFNFTNCTFKANSNKSRTTYKKVWCFTVFNRLLTKELLLFYKFLTVPFLCKSETCLVLYIPFLLVSQKLV